MIGYPDDTRPYHIFVDASDYAVGVALMQERKKVDTRREKEKKEDTVKVDDTGETQPSLKTREQQISPSAYNGDEEKVEKNDDTPEKDGDTKKKKSKSTATADYQAISFYSRTLSESEKKWPAVQKELLGISRRV